MNEDLEDAFDRLMGGFNDFARLVQQKDKRLYERWKAGGFIVSDNVASVYPDAGSVYEELQRNFQKQENEDENSYS